MSVEAQPAERALTRREIPSDDAGAAAWNLMLAGELYVSAQPHLAALRAEAKRLTLHYNGALGNGSDLAARSIHLGETFGAIGANAVVEPPFRVDYGLNVRVGANFYANFDCVFLDW